MTQKRTRRPVIVIGYGEQGEAWLESVAQRIASLPVLEGMLRDRVIQFWALGIKQASGDTIVSRFSEAPDAQEVRRRLDAARLARFQGLYGLDLYQPVLVLERWRLFDEASELRVQLRDAFSIARHVDCDPHQSRELDILWVTLADAVRAAARPAPAAVRRIRESFRAETIHDVPFLIDRQSEDGGVVDSVLADRCYYDLATAVLASDLAFPAHGAGDRRSSVFSSDTDSGRVHPISVLVLRHPESSILRATERDLLREIRNGDREQLRQWASSVTPLLKVLDDEATLRRQGLLSLSEARTRRNEAAAAALGAALVLRDTQLLQQDVTRTRRQVNVYYPDVSTPGASPAIVATLGTGAATTAQLPIGWREAGAVAAAVLLGTALVVWWRQRTARSVPAPESGENDSIAKAQLRSEWLHLTDRIDAALRQVDSLFASSELPAAGTWQPGHEHPFEWQFQPASVHKPGELALTQSLVHTLARRIMDSADADREPYEAVREALESTASDLLSRRLGTYRTSLTRALGSGDVQVLRSALSSAPLLVNTGRPIENTEILWLVDGMLGADDALVQLEPAAMRPYARVLTSEDSTQTVRIRIGEALEWPAVLSLHFLTN